MTEESHADRHDRDKLERWWQDLSAETEEHASIHAVFLVTEKDRRAHEVFRRYREAYEGHSAPFHSLVIFGQHGSSTASRALARGFGVPDGAIPALVLFQAHGDSRVVVVTLGPSQEESIDDDSLECLIQESCLGDTSSAQARAIAGLVDSRCVADLVRGTLDKMSPGAQGL